MTNLGGTVLVLNAGSSSLKADGYNSDAQRWQWSVAITGITQGEAILKIKRDNQSGTEHNLGTLNFNAAVAELFKAISGVCNAVQAVGHRVVHGGAFYQDSIVIDEQVLDNLKQLEAIDPEHAPISNYVITKARATYPNMLHVACFDSSFFADMPLTSTLLPIPRKYFDMGIRAYGFHGLSYTYLLEEFRRICGDDAARGRVIMAHLGSGASIVALKDGTPLDTTMSFSPTSGIMMSTRSGDIDPSVVWQLQHTEKLSADEVKTLMNTQSGLVGISEISADMYTLLESDDSRANDAVIMFCNSVKKSIGAYSALLGGVDSIIFAGGIGENAPRIRWRVLEDMDYLGIKLDEFRNNESSELISAADSRVGVHVIPTNESIVIAKEVMQIVNKV